MYCSRLLSTLLAGTLLLAAHSSFAQQSMQLNVNQGLGATGVGRDESGRRVSFICPASDGATIGTVYGTDVYTDSSPICPAAIHAGVLRARQAGVVTIVLGVGVQSFQGSARNGVTTQSFARHAYWYTFGRDGEPGTIAWQTTWNWNERPTATLSEPFAVACPAGGAPVGLIYGTDVYSVGSAICVAAVHAGVITPREGGVVQVTRVPAQRDDPGSERFGVASRRLSATPEAFAVARASASENPAAGSQGCSEAVVIAQTFDDMKANIARPFDGLLRQAQGDAAKVAALTAQRDRLVGEVESFKQQNLSTACSGVPPRTTQNVPTPVEPVTQRPARDPAPATPPPADPSSQRSPAPQLVSIVPDILEQNAANVRLVLRGQGTSWQASTTAIDLGPGISTLGGPTIASPTEAYVDVAVAADAQLGPRRVTLTTIVAGRAEVVGLPDTLRVNAPQPTLSTVILIPPLQTPPSAGASGTPGSGNAGAAPPVNNTGIVPGSVVTSPAGGTLTAAPGALPAPSGVIPSNWYLITVSQLICVSPTKDDTFALDGRGDEIYAAAYVRKYDRTTGALAAFSSTQTQVYGDSANSNRIKAGTQSGGGGITAGDHIPDGGRVQRLTPVLGDQFPWRVWEGELRSNIDALVISPSVWESDGRNDRQVFWVRQQGEISSTLFAHGDVAARIADGTTFGPIVLGVNAIENTIMRNLDQMEDGALAAIIGSTLGFPAPNIINEAIDRSPDRPVGLRQLSNSVGADIVLPNTVIVLTREIIEAALNRPHVSALPSGVPGEMLQIPGAGYILVGFADRGSEYGPGAYTMVLQVERIPTPPQATAPAQ